MSTLTILWGELATPTDYRTALTRSAIQKEVEDVEGPYDTDLSRDENGVWVNQANDNCTDESL